MCRFSGDGGEFLSFTGKGSRGAACATRLTEQLPKRVFHFSHGYDFYAGLDFFAAFYIVARYYYAFEAEFLGFEYSLGNACHGAYLAAQSYLAGHAHGAVDGRGNVARQHGSHHGQGDGRVGHAQPARNDEGHVFLDEFEANALFEHGQKDVHAAYVEPCGRALRHSVGSCAYQGLCFD